MTWRVILIWLLGICQAPADFSHRLHTVVTSGGLQNLAYTYDQVGDIASVSDGAYGGASSASISSASYDDLHRLLSFTRPGTGQTVSCTYDSVGNMTLDSENGSGAYTYGASGGRLPHAVQSANGVYYAYDPAGNMVVRGNQQLFYDADNRLTNILGPTGNVTFGYDGGGARLWKQGSPTNTLQVWIGGDYEEKDGKILYHISADGRLVCTFDAANSVFEYYHPDHLHSAEVLSTTSGAFYQHYEYAAYGQGRYTNSSIAFPISARYTSQNLDEETGLYCYAARYYDPVLGRFIQPDTMIANAFNPQAYDRYAYALDNPLLYVDPDGHAPWYFYIPWIGPGAAQVQGTLALNAQAERYNYVNYNIMAAQLGIGQTSPTAGDVSAIQGTAKIAGGAANAYVTIGQEITTAGISTGITAATTAERTVVRTATEGAEQAEGGSVQRAEMNVRAAASPKEGIYEFPDAQNSGKTYVGQSGNLPERIKTHELRGRKAADTPAEITAVSGGKTQREIAEQHRIDELGGTRNHIGSQTSNIRNPISPERREELNMQPPPQDLAQ